MMSLAPVSVHQGRHYYQQDNYYTHGQNVENSAWFGRGAAELGLTGAVKAKDFDELLIGVDPTSGNALTGRQALESEATNKRAGLDLTFSAPKSVSLAAFLGGDARLEEAHQRAVDAALRVAEERYSMTRSGGQKDRRTEVAGNFIVAQFRHDTSRAKDPQMHTHCVVINAVRRADGEWRSLSNDAIYSNSKLLSLVYRNELAREVQSLGYTVTTRAHGMFEINGYSPAQLEAFSKRRQQLVELGAETPEQAQRLVKIDRPTKGKELPRNELELRWQSEAQALGVIHPKAHEIAGRSQFLDHREVMGAGARHASERDVTFRRETLERFALETNLGRIELRELDHQVRMAGHRGELVEHAPGRYTTAAALETERGMLSLLQSGKSRYAPIVAEVPREIRDNTLGFSDGQRDALEKSLTSRDEFLAWQGVAGAGKTFAMKHLKAVSESSGVTVRGFAPSAEAAKVLADETKLATNTVAGMLVSKQAATDKRGRELWIVDEAGLLSAKDARAVMERARAEGARLILVGDTRQLSSVEAGNPFKFLQQRGITTAHLTESRRQKTEHLKQAAVAMAKGLVAHGLRWLEDDIVEFKRQSTRVRHVAQEYLALSPDERAKTLVLAGTNREREMLTAAIRDGLRTQGVLGTSAKTVSLYPKDATREEIMVGRKIVSGDVLAFHKDYRRLGITKGMQLDVTAVDIQNRLIRARRPDGEEVTLIPERTPAFQVFEAREREVSVGDLMRWTKNERPRGLRNGQGLRVDQITDDRIILTSREGDRVELGRKERAYFDHDYVNTTYASQGKTCERVVISADKTFGKEAMYVAVTRAKTSVTLYTEDKERMCRLAEVSRAKVSAMEVAVAPAKQQQPDQRVEAPAQGQQQEQRRGRGLGLRLSRSR